MKEKLLIFTLYAVPYRTELFRYLAQKFDTTVIYEISQGDHRNEDYFDKSQNGVFLDTEEGKQLFKEVKKHLKRYALVAIYEWSTKTGCALIAECKKRHISFVINCDGVILQKHGNAITEFVKKMALKGADAYLVSGTQAKDYFLKYGADESKIYFHGFTALNKDDILDKPIDSSAKAYLRRKLGLPIQGKIAIAVGRFIALKRYDFLIELWSHMKERQYLLIIGGGPEEERYREIIRKYNQKNVIIEGYHDKEELKLYYQASDVLVHPTSYDVWGLVINEAMANGVPVVASDRCVAALELIKQGENGIVVSMENNEQWFEEIQRVFKDGAYAEHLASGGISTIQPYTIENMAVAHIKVFNKLISMNKVVK